MDGEETAQTCVKACLQLQATASAHRINWNGYAMRILKDMHELRVIGSPADCRELRRMLSEAISRGHVEQIPVTKPHRNSLNESWYRDKETGQIYSLHPFDERPGSWMEVDPKDLIETDDAEEREPTPNGEARVPPLIGILFFKHEVYGREADDLIRAISQLARSPLRTWRRSPAGSFH